MDPYIEDPLDPYHVDLSKLDVYEAANLQTRRAVHHSNYEFSGYKDFLKLYNDKKEKILKTPLEEKCIRFFSQWSEKHPFWIFTTYQNLSERYDKKIVNKKDYFERVKKELLADRSNEELTREDKITMQRLYDEEVARSKKVHADMADTISVMRLYGKCFLNSALDPPSKRSNESTQLFNDYTERIFHFFDKQVLPEFFSADLEKALPKNTYPKFDSNDKYSGYLSYNPDTMNLLDFMSKKANGRGIVISAKSGFTKDIVKLIRVLRALNNKLPIQIIHRGDFDKELKQKVQHVATQSVEELLDPKSAPEFDKVTPEISLLDSYSDFSSIFPKQDIWFVNIESCIEKDFKHVFPSFSNRNLALVFSSFKDVILLDADTVPLVPLKKFFEMKEYVNTGTHYFQDRALRQNNDWIDTNYFLQLLPNKENSLDTLFGIPLLTSKTLGNKYMTGWKHYMEAGVVVFDKSRHFMGMMMTLPLCLWREPAMSAIWGDKETYWLGLSMAGDENYSMNELGAASVGEISSKDHVGYPNTTATEVCSTHPGHVYKDTGELLWLNSGFTFCKNNGYDVDMNKFPFSVFDVHDLQVSFEKPLQVKAAVVPPEIPSFRPLNSPPDAVNAEKAFMESWKKRKPDYDELPDMKDGQDRRISAYGPQKSWVTTGICYGYYYCAYDQVTAYGDESKLDLGNLFRFSALESRTFDYLGKMWMTGSTVVVPEPGPVVE